MVEIVNIVAGGDLNRELDLEGLKSELASSETLSSEFSGEGTWQLIIRFEKQGTAILYRTGKYILRGGSEPQNMNNLKTSFLQTMRKVGVIHNINDAEYAIQNIVFLEELSFSVDLNEAVVQLGIENVEYEPEQFPGLIYRPEDFDLVMLIFSSGKIIITGSTLEKNAESAINALSTALVT
jgi:transcription initiation factor TFIID TATA-box-binding protein